MNNQKIPLVDLRVQHDSLKQGIDNAISEVIAQSSFIKGPFLERFEKNFAAYCGSRYCIGTSNGTSSLYCALKAMGIGKGHEVITAANTFIATTEAISLTGAKPVLADIGEDDFNISADTIRGMITERTRAIVPVHLYGHPADMDPIYELAEKYGLSVVEDAAQAHGALYKSKKIGARGTVSFSFFPAKILGCFGDGGCITTNDSQIAENIRMEIDHGRKDKYEHIKEGFNFRLDALQANILNAKLPNLDRWISTRRELAKRYSDLLPSDVIKPSERKDCKHSFYMYVIRVKNSIGRHGLKCHLEKKGIGCGIHYPIPLHLQPAYRGFFKGDFFVTEKVSDQILSIPLYPELTEVQQDYIIDSISDFYNAGN